MKGKAVHAFIAIGGLAISSNTWAFKIISFNGKFTRFASNQIHYQIDSRGSHDFNGNAMVGCDGHGPCVTVQQAIEKSFESWTKVTGVNLSFIEDPPTAVTKTGNDGKNQVTFVESNWGGQSFTPPQEALAVTISTYKISTGEIIDSDTHFNGVNFHWAVIDTPEEQNGDLIDIQNVATHEFGHFIGLDHSSEDIFEPILKLYQATMFYASGPGETFRRELKEDDQEAVENLYPVSEPLLPS